MLVQNSWKLEFGHNIERGSGVWGESLASETYHDSFGDFVSFVLSGIVWTHVQTCKNRRERIQACWIDTFCVQVEGRGMVCRLGRWGQMGNLITLLLNGVICVKKWILHFCEKEYEGMYYGIGNYFSWRWTKSNGCEMIKINFAKPYIPMPY